MNTRFASIFLAIALLGLGVGGSEAKRGSFAYSGDADASHEVDPYRPGGLRAPSLPLAPQMADSQATLAPLAFVKFCMDYQEQCRTGGKAERIALAAENWSTLVRINRDINSRIAPDAGKRSFEWSLEATVGDCNDYAVQKRKALVDAGFPISALSLTVAITQQGVGHLVLTVRTDRGDFILDNLRPNIVAANRTGYRMVKRQAAHDPRFWVSIGAPGAPVVARLEPAARVVRVPARPAPRNIAAQPASFDLASADLTLRLTMIDEAPAATDALDLRLTMAMPDVVMPDMVLPEMAE